MGLFRDDPAAIEACIDVLRLAQAVEDPEQRRRDASRVLILLQDLRGAASLEPGLREQLAAGDLDGAMALLRGYRDGPLPGPSRGSKLLVLLLGSIVVASVGPCLTIPRTAASHRAALRLVEDCEPARDVVGQDLRLPRLAWYSGTSWDGDTPQFARWTIPVEGDRGRGRLHYHAEERGGRWEVLRATLVSDGVTYAIAPCWGAIDPADAGPELEQGGEWSATVVTTEGAAPVSDGALCRVSIRPERVYRNSYPHNCHVRVECGDHVLFGTLADNGLAVCHPLFGEPAWALDPFGTADSVDPMLRLDAPAGTLVLSDDAPGSAYSIRFALGDPPL